MTRHGLSVPSGWLAAGRDVLRVSVAGLVLVPGMSKLLTRAESVRFFAALDLPAPSLLAPVVGLVEVGVAVALLADRGAWLAALALVPMMVVAAVIAGPTWQNVGVGAGAFVLAVRDLSTRQESLS